MEKHSKAAFVRVSECFTSDAVMASAFGVHPSSVHRWRINGLPELRALQADKYLGITYKPSEYGFDVGKFTSVS